jgi:penicillin-binding protein 1C
MDYLHRRLPSRAPAAPPGLVQVRAQFGQQLEAARGEWFLQGTEQTLFAINSEASTAHSARAGGLKHSPPEDAPASQAAPRITAPAPGTIVALDPDIPPGRQRLLFTAEGGAARWLMDGKPLAQGTQVQWLPWPGRHVVQLADGSGQVVDEIRIEVRGAGVKAAAPTHQGPAPREGPR